MKSIAPAGDPDACTIEGSHKVMDANAQEQREAAAAGTTRQGSMLLRRFKTPGFFAGAAEV